MLLIAMVVFDFALGVKADVVEPGSDSDHLLRKAM